MDWSPARQLVQASFFRLPRATRVSAAKPDRAVRRTFTLVNRDAQGMAAGGKSTDDASVYLAIYLRRDGEAANVPRHHAHASAVSFTYARHGQIR